MLLGSLEGIRISGVVSGYRELVGGLPEAIRIFGGYWASARSELIRRSYILLSWIRLQLARTQLQVCGLVFNEWYGANSQPKPGPNENQGNLEDIETSEGCRDFGSLSGIGRL